LYTYLKVGLASETGNIACTVTVGPDRHTFAVLGCNGLVACDIVVMFFVREVQHQIVGAIRVHYKFDGRLIIHSYVRRITTFFITDFLLIYENLNTCFIINYLNVSPI